MSAPLSLKYLFGYPEHLVCQVRELLEDRRLGPWLLKKYPQLHGVRSDTALYEYVSELKARHLRNADPLSKVAFDGKLQTIHNALGTHTTVARVQGGKLKTKREIRVANLFREAPPEFLRMIVVHELAHLKERQHDKAFYQLCCRMEPDYHQFEFDVRAWLCWLEATGDGVWTPAGTRP
jgi:predicted metal-dependent hydrolase